MTKKVMKNIRGVLPGSSQTMGQPEFGVAGGHTPRLPASSSTRLEQPGVQGAGEMRKDASDKEGREDAIG